MKMPIFGGKEMTCLSKGIRFLKAIRMFTDFHGWHKWRLAASLADHNPLVQQVVVNHRY
jgi:hypothetical protein